MVIAKIEPQSNQQAHLQTSAINTICAENSDWFFIPVPRPAARWRLICIPYAGAAPWALRAWSAALPTEIEVCTICLPGRGKQINVPHPVNIDMLTQTLCKAMTHLRDKPYVLFGHSFGGLMAFALAGALEQEPEEKNFRLPEHVFISGCPAPAHCAQRPALHTLSDQAFITAVDQLYSIPVEVMSNPALLAMTISLLRADLKLAASYVEKPSIITPPITAFFGTADPETSVTTVDQWRRHTSGTFSAHSYTGGHFFLHKHSAAMMTVMERGFA